MRMLLKARLGNEAAGKQIDEGVMLPGIQAMVDRLKPEAIYFYPDNGRRSFFMVFDMKDPSQIVEIAERLFHRLDAEVQYSPVMNHEDLKKGIEAYHGQERKAA